MKKFLEIGYPSAIGDIPIDVIIDPNQKIEGEYHPTNIFEPSYFSFSITKCLKLTEEESALPILDLGTGTGFLGIYLSEIGAKKIYLSDIYPEALICAERNIKKNNIKVEDIVESDLFKNLRNQKFGLIVSNPPAYPEAKGLSLNEGMDLAVLSGKTGRFFIEKFIKEAKFHLISNGRIVFAYPSFLGKEKIEKDLKKEGYSFKILKRVETRVRTYGYDIERFLNNWLKSINQNIIDRKYWIHDSKYMFELMIIEARKG